MSQERPSQSDNVTSNGDLMDNRQEAGCLFALISNRRSVSRRNRASWFLRQLNKIVRCDPIELIESDEQPIISEANSSQNDANHNDDILSMKEKVDSKKIADETNAKDIYLVSVTSRQNFDSDNQEQNFSVTTNTRVVYLTKSIATSIVLDLSPSIVTVSPQNNGIFLDSMFEALKRVLNLLIKEQEVPSATQSDKPFNLVPKVFVTVIAYTPFVVAKNNQVIIQNRRISSSNIEQVLVEIWVCLNRLINELHELVSNSCGINLEYDSTKANGTAFVFPQPISGGIIRHPGSVLEDIYELGLFSAHLMPRLSRLSIVIISDGLFASTNNLNIFRLKSIAVSFVSLSVETISPDASFGYTSYSDLMRFVSKSTQGVYITYKDLIQASECLAKTRRMSLVHNPLFRLFCWTLHSDIVGPESFNIGPSMDCHNYEDDEEDDSRAHLTPRASATPNSKSYNDLQQAHHHQRFFDLSSELSHEQIAKFFCIDQSLDAFASSTGAHQNFSSPNDNHPKLNPTYHDWRSYKQLERELDADFEQVLSCLLREGYLIKHIHIKHRETSKIVARLVLHWKHNLDLEQELTAPYWRNQSDLFDLNNGSDLILRQFNGPLYGDTFCEIFVHGSYSFLHNLYCDRKVKRRSEYREIANKQFRHLIDGVLQTHERLQYLSRFYRDATLSMVPPFLLHGNSLLYEQPHTHKLTSTIENVVDDAKTNEFQKYWQKISYLDTKSWKNLMHVHTLRLVLEHDQPKHKNIHCQNANGRYTHIQCRRAMSAISNFIKSYASFALLEDSTYVKFIYNKDNDLREIETSATKGFIVIRINKLLPIVVIYLMFTSGILDSHRVQIVSFLEDQLVNCKIRNARISMTTQSENILRSKTVYPSNESCCVLIRSPLERMLKVYNRNFITESLAQNPALGLPGSHPIINQKLSATMSNGCRDIRGEQQQQQSVASKSRGLGVGKNHNHIEEHNPAESSINRHDLVFGKYLYGVRVVHTIAHLPHELVQSLATNVLTMISAILVNVRIKQGFHIAFNNSGTLNLVVELKMQDHSHKMQHSSCGTAEAHQSTCLCQYMIFPPIITSMIPKPNQIQYSDAPQQQQTFERDGSPISQVGSPNGSLANSDISFQLKNSPSNLNTENTTSSSIVDNVTYPSDGEVKVIREYWTEQQYGLSADNETEYHKSLSRLRYAEVVDHLYLTDTRMFDCLLTYDILQLLCDKLSPFNELDVTLCKADILSDQLQMANSNIASQPHSPTNSSSFCSYVGLNDLVGPNSPTNIAYPQTSQLPSTLIEGNTKEAGTRVPLIELTYKFSIVKFLNYCQQASLNVLLFRDKSDFYDSTSMHVDSGGLLRNLDLGSRPNGERKFDSTSNTAKQPSEQTRSVLINKTTASRKLSIDVNMLEHESQSSRGRREHRSSYDSLNYTSAPLGTSQSAAALHGAASHPLNSMCCPTLNHCFLETLHKRLRQMHDKELRLTNTDRRLLGEYLKNRKAARTVVDCGGEKKYGTDMVDGLAGPVADQWDTSTSEEVTKSTNDQTIVSCEQDEEDDDDGHIDWRCFMRKRNQENMMIVFVPSSLKDISKWMQLVSPTIDSTLESPMVCPIFVFRCSSTMLNERVLSFLHEHSDITKSSTPTAEADLSLHFGQPCKYFGELLTSNDELDHEILALNTLSDHNTLNQSDEKTIEIVHFRAFLRKIKNTVLKSRFSSLNDAYSSELFIHKDDLLYYIYNVDTDTQKKYHVSTQLKNLCDFLKIYEDYLDSLPKEPVKTCNQLLNSILLQKCGIFLNQPIARFNESNPLMKQLQDSKLLFLMRCNYKIELPILEESLSQSRLLKSFVVSRQSVAIAHRHQQHLAAGRNRPLRVSQAHLSPSNLNQQGENLSPPANIPVGSLPTATATSSAASSLTNQNACSTASGAKLMEMRYGSSIGSSGGGVQSYSTQYNVRGSPHAPRFSSFTSTASQPAGAGPLACLIGDSFILEAFKNEPCSMEETSTDYQYAFDDLIDERPMAADEAICHRHEAHMAEVMRRKSEKRETNHYRRVLKSKTNYSQSHGAIDQALKRVDSLGRLEHFCLTPLLFSPAWRSKLAPVRDHTLRESYSSAGRPFGQQQQQQQLGGEESYFGRDTLGDPGNQSEQQIAAERWHQMVCNNYIKEYEQYIQTLGFNSVQIRYPSSAASGAGATITRHTNMRSSVSSRKNSTRFSTQFDTHYQNQCSQSPQDTQRGRALGQSRRGSSINTSLSTSQQTPPHQPSSSGQSGQAASVQNIPAPAYNTGYLIKFLNSGCLVFKVGFCRPYVYSILYSIEGERFNNGAGSSGSKSARLEAGGSARELKMNSTTAFLDELDNIKVTMHLHSFTYDYHLRSMYSYISGRQMTFSPGYHLISFVDDFRKYYQKAPNYARNHILSGEVVVNNLAVDGQQLYNYIVTHNSFYNLDILEMTTETNGDSLVSRIAAAAAGVDRSQGSPSEHSAPSATVLAELLADTSSYRNHANDYVLIELKREKVRYRDGKDVDIFDCGLLITHSECPCSLRGSKGVPETSRSDNCLALKYFLLLTNQRDLYPKLVHSPDDSVISLGCHRPIRLGSNTVTAMGQMLQATNAIQPTTVASEPMSIINASLVGASSRFKMKQLAALPPPPPPLPPPIMLSTSVSTTTAPSDLDDARSSNEIFLSSGELSGPPSILSTAPSIQSSAGQQFTTTTTNSDNEGSGLSIDSQARQLATIGLSSPPPALSTASEQDDTTAPAEEAADALALAETVSSQMALAANNSGHPIARSSSYKILELPAPAGQVRHLSAPPEGSEVGHKKRRDESNTSFANTPSIDSEDGKDSYRTSPEQGRKQATNEAASSESKQGKTTAICDEEITYLGYFSSDEMDMLKFLQDKTDNLRSHIERIVRAAEIHYRRDYLWQKLMQQDPEVAPAQPQAAANPALNTSQAVSSANTDANNVSSKVHINIADQFQAPLSVDELVQLLKIVQAVDLSKLDPQLTNFTSMNLNWYLKLLKAFNDLKQWSGNTHRIYQVKASKTLLIFIDPKCTGALILLALDVERGSAEISLLLKDKQELGSTQIQRTTISDLDRQEKQAIDLDIDCQHLINDFVNFCAAFMWSTFLTG